MEKTMTKTLINRAGIGFDMQVLIDYAAPDHHLVRYVGDGYNDIRVVKTADLDEVIPRMDEAAFLFKIPLESTEVILKSLGFEP